MSSCSAEFNGAGELLACAGSEVCVWRESKEQQLTALCQFKSSATVVKARWCKALDHLGRAMVSVVDERGRCALWVLEGGKWGERFVFSEAKTTDVESCPARFGPAFAVSGDDGAVCVFEQVSHRVEDWEITETLQEANGGDYATCLSWDPNGACAGLAVGTNDGHLTIWRKPNAWLRHETRSLSRKQKVQDIAWSPQPTEEPLLAVATASGILLSFGAARLVPLYDNPTTSLFWNDSGSHLAATDKNRVCRVWKRDFQDRWVLLREYQAPSSSPVAAAITAF